LKLDNRVYKCDKCGLTIDRDLNASLNLERLAVSSTESGKTPVGEGRKLWFVRSETAFNESGIEHKTKF